MRNAVAALRELLAPGYSLHDFDILTDNRPRNLPLRALFLWPQAQYDEGMSDEHDGHEHAEQHDIDFILRQWPFKPGVIAARLVRAGDGREVIQMRIEMGLLQMETTGRPDGEHPGGVDTCLDWLHELARVEGESFALNEEQCMEIDREFVQFYHRRICCLALRQFARAVADADYTLGADGFRGGPFAQSAMDALARAVPPVRALPPHSGGGHAGPQRAGPEAAIETINQGLEQMREVFAKFGAEEQFEQDELVGQLGAMKESLRQEYRVGKTLAEQLADAVAAEEYERAARLRDEIEQRFGGIT